MIGRDKFVAWLKAKGADDLVGMAGNIRSCPIATFLCETRGGGWTVGKVTYVHEHTHDTVKTLPMWARDFVYEVDCAGVDSPISAKAALEKLEAVK